MKWIDGAGIDVKDLKQHLEDRLKTGLYSKAIVGCDSQSYKEHVVFVIVVILDTNGQGAQFVYNKKKLSRKEFHSMNERLLKEVEYSVGLAIEYVELFNKYNVPISIHADVNPNEDYASNIIMKDVVGWIVGVGFECVIKPDSFGASCIADKFTN